jgi:hypothetical protein
MGIRGAAGVVDGSDRRVDKASSRLEAGSLDRLSIVAWIIGCFAAALFVLATLLPSYTFTASGSGMSFYDAVIRFGPRGTVARAGGYLFVYAGPIILLLLAVDGLARRGRRSLRPTTFAGAGLAWGVAAIGLLLSQAQSGLGHGIGYLAMVLGASLGIVGGLLEVTGQGVVPDASTLAANTRSKPTPRAVAPAKKRRHR